MKKVVLLASVAALVALASCKKSGTCTCKDKDGKVSSITKYEDAKIKNLKASCTYTKYEDKVDGTTIVVDNDSKTTCEWSK